MANDFEAGPLKASMLEGNHYENTIFVQDKWVKSELLNARIKISKLNLILIWSPSNAFNCSTKLSTTVCNKNSQIILPETVRLTRSRKEARKEAGVEEVGKKVPFPTSFTVPACASVASNEKQSWETTFGVYLLAGVYPNFYFKSATLSFAKNGSKTFYTELQTAFACSDISVLCNLGKLKWLGKLIRGRVKQQRASCWLIRNVAFFRGKFWLMELLVQGQRCKLARSFHTGIYDFSNPISISRLQILHHLQLQRNACCIPEGAKSV